MQILELLGMYFDAVVVEVKTFLLLFKMALAILCWSYIRYESKYDSHHHSGRFCPKTIRVVFCLLN